MAITPLMPVYPRSPVRPVIPPRIDDRQGPLNLPFVGGVRLMDSDPSQRMNVALFSRQPCGQPGVVILD